MFESGRRKSFPLGKAKELGRDATNPKVLNTGQSDFDDVIRHFGRNASQFGMIRPNTTIQRSPTHIATPVTVIYTPVSGPAASELIAQQSSVIGRIPLLARIAIAGFAITNLMLLILYLVH
jgi:hypothetical protein